MIPAARRRRPDSPLTRRSRCSSSGPRSARRSRRCGPRAPPPRRPVPRRGLGPAGARPQRAGAGPFTGRRPRRRRLVGVRAAVAGRGDPRGRALRRGLPRRRGRAAAAARPAGVAVAARPALHRGADRHGRRVASGRPRCGRRERRPCSTRRRRAGSAAGFVDRRPEVAGALLDALAADDASYAWACEALAEFDVRPAAPPRRRPGDRGRGHARRRTARVGPARASPPGSRRAAGRAGRRSPRPGRGSGRGRRRCCPPARLTPDDAYEAGPLVRRAVLGEAHVDRSLAGATEVTGEFQEFITATSGARSGPAPAWTAAAFARSR